MTSPLHVARTIRKELGGNRFVDSPYQWGVVHAVHTSPDTVDLYLDGSSTLTPAVRYLASYYPTVGDVVKVDRFRSDRVVVGTLANGVTPIAGLMTAAYHFECGTISNFTAPDGWANLGYTESTLQSNVATVSAWNSGSYFVAPVTGAYDITASLILAGASAPASVYRLFLQYGAATQAATPWARQGITEDAAQYGAVSLSMSQWLVAGHAVWVQAFTTGGLVGGTVTGGVMSFALRGGVL